MKDTSQPRLVNTRSVKRMRVKSDGSMVTFEETRVLYDNNTVGVYKDTTEAHFMKLRKSKLVSGYSSGTAEGDSSFASRTVLPARVTPSRSSARVASQPVLPTVEAPAPAKVVLNMGTIVQVQSEGVSVSKKIKTVLDMDGGREQIKEILKQPGVIAGLPLRKAMRMRSA